jgi:hypothetical protein
MLGVPTDDIRKAPSDRSGLAAQGDGPRNTATKRKSDPALLSTARLAALFNVPLAIAAGWLLWHSLDWPLAGDATIFHFIAGQFQMGAVPYRDIFDINCYPSSRSTFLLSRLTSPGLIPGPTNSFPDTSATASASSPSFTGTLLRTNSMALSLSDSYARKFRTIRGFPSESKVVTRMFHPAGILGTMRPYCHRSMACLIQTDPPKVWSALHHGVSFSPYREGVAGPRPRLLPCQ